MEVLDRARDGVKKVTASSILRKLSYVKSFTKIRMEVRKDRHYTFHSIRLTIFKSGVLPG